MAVSCGEDEGGDSNPVASFQFEADESDWHIVHFTNFSKNADDYSWDFGDDTAESTEEDPSHTYEEGGTYTVTLTATGGGKTAVKTQVVTVTDPDVALTLLAGEVSKTWKLFREGTSMSLGTVEVPGSAWPGLTNNGARPCMYEQTFTFERDGGYVFDDNGSFWAEYGVFNNVAGCDQNTGESCMDATVANMKNACGEDVSDWLSGTHSYTYNSATGELTLSGLGAWIGIPKLGTTGETRVPVSEVKTKITITQETGYDVMLVEFIHGTNYWPIYYVHYTNELLEPVLVTDTPVFGEDLTDITPTELGHTFESDAVSSFDLLGLLGGGSIITPGQDDPTNPSGTKVGKFDRVAVQYQEAQLRTSPNLNDIVFTNFTTVSVDVYLPSTNTYATPGLTKKVIIGFGDVSQTEQWWTDIIQYESAELALDQWVPVTFTLTQPLKDRTDMDMVFLQIGGGDHFTAATFYVKNLRFNP